MFLGLIPYSILVYKLLIAVPAQMIFPYAEARMLTMPHKRVFLIVEALGTVGFFSFQILIPDAVMVVMGLFFIVVLPAAMSSDSFLYRILVVGGADVIMLVAEIPLILVWSLVLGTPYDSALLYQNLPMAYLFGIALIVELVFLMAAFEFILGKIVKGRPAELEHGATRDALLPVAHTLACMMAVLLLSVSTVSLGAYATAIVSLGISGASVAVLYVSLYQYASKRQSDIRSEIHQESLASQLDNFEAVAKDVERTAALRHDLRNQMQMAVLLVRSGEPARARAHIEEMREMCLEADSGGAGGTDGELSDSCGAQSEPDGKGGEG